MKLVTKRQKCQQNEKTSDIDKAEEAHTTITNRNKPKNSSDKIPRKPYGSVSRTGKYASKSPRLSPKMDDLGSKKFTRTNTKNSKTSTLKEKDSSESSRGFINSNSCASNNISTLHNSKIDLENSIYHDVGEVEDDSYVHDYCQRLNEITKIKGNITFGNESNINDESRKNSTNYSSHIGTTTILCAKPKRSEHK